jgi:hypothetical protein
MLKETNSKYFVLSNNTYSLADIKDLWINKKSYDAQHYYDQKDIKVKLPDDFINYKGNKYIKFYGCTLHNYIIHLDDSSTYWNLKSEETIQPIHTTLHSNLVNMSNTLSIVDNKVIYVDNDPLYNYVNTNNDYLSTTNNYLNQKIFKIPDDFRELRFYFVNHFGDQVYIVKKYKIDLVSPQDGIFEQCLYKIEMELIKE